MSDLFVAEVGEPEGGVLPVRVAGEFDIEGVDSFRGAIDDALARDGSVIELDLGHISFIDSSGVGAIIVAARAAQERGRAMRIGERSAIVARVLAVSGLEDALEPPG